MLRSAYPPGGTPGGTPLDSLIPPRRLWKSIAEWKELITKVAAFCTKETCMQALFDRRHVLYTTTGLLVAGSAPVATAVMAQHNDQEAPAEKVSPPEDLMREHGVLNRVLLIYENVIRKIEDKHDFDPHIIHRAAVHRRLPRAQRRTAGLS
jgi:hypothetical protein